MIAGWSLDIFRQFENTAASDKDLLDRFVRERDEHSFTELVKRHGAIVLGVARRVTRHEQDAEDAFQAVFLTLARNSHRIRNADLLGNWLYGVALRIAARAKRAALRRGRREILVRELPDRVSLPEPPVSDVLPILEEELAALPGWYREAIVLCDLRGVSRAEAAAALQVPEGTVSSRLASGRKKLAARLSKRGIALSAAILPASVSTLQAIPIVPNELVKKSCGRVFDMLAGKTLPKPLLILTEGEMTVRKSLMLVLSSLILATGVAFAMQPAEDPPTSESPKQVFVKGKKETPDQPVQAVKLEEKAVEYSSQPRLGNVLDVNVSTIYRVFWNSTGSRLAIDGESVRDGFRVDDPKAIPPDAPGSIRLSVRDGFRVNEPSSHVIQVIGQANTADKLQLDGLQLQDAQKKLKSRLVGFTADGKMPVTLLDESNLISGYHNLFYWSGRDVGRTLDLQVSGIQDVIFASDDKTFRTVTVQREPFTGVVKSVAAIEVDATSGKQLKTLVTAEGRLFCLSFDGSRLAVIGTDNNVSIYDVNRGVLKSTVKLPEDWHFEKQQNIGDQHFSRKYSLQLSPHGSHLVVCSGVSEENQGVVVDGKSSTGIAGNAGKTLVVDTENGKPLPLLEDAECLSAQAEPFAFSGDGRLLTLSGVKYHIIKKNANLKSIYTMFSDSHQDFMTVWDTQTGKVLKSWEHRPKRAAFNPAKPILAIFERNDDWTRIGYWDFAAEAIVKK